MCNAATTDADTPSKIQNTPVQIPKVANNKYDIKNTKYINSNTKYGYSKKRLMGKLPCPAVRCRNNR